VRRQTMAKMTKEQAPINTTSIGFRYFSIGVKDEDVNKFIDELELLCKKYALHKKDYWFRFETE
jgi:hypothetical protein